MDFDEGDVILNINKLKAKMLDNIIGSLDDKDLQDSDIILKIIHYEALLNEIEK